MSRMQYGEFVFPHNPRRIELSYTGTLAPQVFPGCGAAVQELGPRCRVARCEGEVLRPHARGRGGKACGNLRGLHGRRVRPPLPARRRQL